MAAVALVAISLPSGSPAAGADPVPAPGVQLVNGRLVTPAGSEYDVQRQAGDAAYDLGDFPLGLALSPLGTIAVASLAGRGTGQPAGFGSSCDTLSPGAAPCPGVPSSAIGSALTKTPDEGLDVIDLATGQVVQVVAVPTSYDRALRDKSTGCQDRVFNCFGMGVAFSPDGAHVYASGSGADEIYDFAVSGTALTLAARTKVPSLVEQQPALPAVGKTFGGPRGLTVTPEGRTLVVASEFDSTVETFDVSGGKAPTLKGQGLVPGGVSAFAPVAYLDAVTASPDSSTAYVSAQGIGTVFAVPIATVPPLPPTGIPLALPSVPILAGDHPTGLAVSPDGRRLLVANANSDDLSVVPLVGNVPTGPVTKVPLSVVPGRPLGSVPNGVAFAADGRRAYVVMAGDDAVAVLDTSAAPTVQGYLSAAWYPTAVAVGPKDGRIYTLSAKGYGSRYTPSLGYLAAPGRTLPSGAAITSSDYYDGSNMPGVLTRVTPPDGSRLGAYTARAQADILHAGALDQRPPNSPVPASVGGPSPIDRVVYIVRENRTFDQVFGDLALTRKDVDADPSLQILAAATPNAHQVAGRYAIADRFFSSGEASIQGHWWSSSANTSDYTEKDWRQNYSPRNRPYAPIGPAATPPGCSIFQAMAARAAAKPGFTYRDYGELVGIADAVTSNPKGNVCAGGGPLDAQLDPNYPTNLDLTPDDRTRTAEFLKDINLNPDGTEGTGGSNLRNFSYLIMSQDHTTGLAGKQTPRSQVAQNDAAVGQLISALSKSKYWPTTAVFVTEDDSQDGADHVDGHRNLLLTASPWARQKSADGCLGGYIGHAPYDQASVLRTVELILGVPPMSSYDAGATPLYGLFQDKNRLAQLTASDLAPYEPAPPPPFIDETVASLPKTSQTAELVALSKELELRAIDRGGAQLEAVLWKSVRDDPLPPELALRWQSERAGILPAVDERQLARRALPTADLVLPRARPGNPPELSTRTGQVLPTGGSAACSDVNTPPGEGPPSIGPGQTAPPLGRGSLAGAPAQLAVTGLGGLLLPVGSALLLSALVLTLRARRTA